jgi:N-acetylmuramoyl-L-alanine amidase
MKHSLLLIALALLTTFLLVVALAEPRLPQASGYPAAEGASALTVSVPASTAQPTQPLLAVAAEQTATPGAPSATPLASVAPSLTPPPTQVLPATATPIPTFVAPAQVSGRPLRVFIDPGHGGPDAGAVHVDASGQVDLLEKDVDLDISLRLASLLWAAGFEVRLARTEDRAVMPGANARQELYARVDMANDWGADLFIDVHNNGHPDHTLRGTEIYYCKDRPYSAENIRFAADVLAGIAASLRRAGYETLNRGPHDDTEVYRGHMGVLGPRITRPTRMVAMLGESLFMTNDADAAQLARPEIRQAIAQGYAEGIQAYLAGR